MALYPFQLVVIEPPVDFFTSPPATTNSGGIRAVSSRPLGRMRTPPPAEQPGESAYDREVGTMERLRNYMDLK